MRKENAESANVSRPAVLTTNLNHTFQPLKNRNIVSQETAIYISFSRVFVFYIVILSAHVTGYIHILSGRTWFDLRRGRKNFISPVTPTQIHQIVKSTYCLKPVIYTFILDNHLFRGIYFLFTFILNTDVIFAKL